LGSPTDDFQNGRILIPVLNGGHIPSGRVTIVFHEVTARVDDINARMIPLDAIVERHWRITTYPSIPVIPNGNIYNVEVHIPKVVQEDLKSGKQAFMIAATMTYNDGFPNSPDQSWIFCDTSSYTQATKFFLMRPCDDPFTILQALTTVDRYPDPQYQEK
jgi:hypothetical protein